MPLVQDEHLTTLTSFAQQVYQLVVAKGSEKYARVLNSTYIFMFELSCLNSRFSASIEGAMESSDFRTDYQNAA